MNQLSELINAGLLSTTYINSVYEEADDYATVGHKILKGIGSVTKAVGNKLDDVGGSIKSAGKKAGDFINKQGEYHPSVTGAQEHENKKLAGKARQAASERDNQRVKAKFAAQSDAQANEHERENQRVKANVAAREQEKSKKSIADKVKDSLSSAGKTTKEYFTGTGKYDPEHRRAVAISQDNEDKKLAGKKGLSGTSQLQANRADRERGEAKRMNTRSVAQANATAQANRADRERDEAKRMNTRSAAQAKEPATPAPTSTPAPASAPASTGLSNRAKIGIGAGAAGATGLSAYLLSKNRNQNRKP